MSAIGQREYRLLTRRGSEAPLAGVLVGERVHDAAALLRGSGVDGSSVLAILQRWPQAQETLSVAIERLTPEEGLPLGEIELLAPVLYPRAIFCAGANYWDHVEEMEGPLDRSKRAHEPWFFLKTSAHSVVADGATVLIPEKTKQLDWEAELAVVIGRRAADVAVEDALDVIAGYTIINDLSARDLMKRGDRPAAMTFDWIGQKCFDGAAPMGPWITPAAFVENCHDLDVRLWVGDVLKQSSNTSQLIHDVYEQIAWLSRQLTLMPGDVIATGTPSGVGMPRNDYLKAGDVVRIEIDRCGVLTNSFA